ncbi:hypothetical protein V7S43_010784 [Phytophthora oleae]|uniref:Uncharacterized protein n=1 Tax=Phytophthora oleae TaxID=2107226 RepID=A0ABD3FG11_9STRA
MEVRADCKPIQVASAASLKRPPPPEERRWAGHCGCDGSCEFQNFNEDMELIDSRTEKTQDEEGSPPLILHLLLMW